MPSRASTRRSGAALSRHGGMPACRAEVTGGQKMQHALKTGGRKMTRADSEKLRFELRRRPTSARTSWQQNKGQGKPQAKVTHRLAQRSPVWRCGGYTPRWVALNSMARLITMLPERALHRADSEKLCFELRRRPTSARTSWQLNQSRLFFEGTVTATDMDRATDTREKGRIGI